MSDHPTDILVEIDTLLANARLKYGYLSKQYELRLHRSAYMKLRNACSWMRSTEKSFSAQSEDNDPLQLKLASYLGMPIIVDDTTFSSGVVIVETTIL